MSNKLIDMKDGTIADLSTGLMWEKVGSPEHFVYLDVVKWVENTALPNLISSYLDWKLPTVHELKSIVDCTKGSPAINEIFDCIADMYWTIEDVLFDNRLAWCVDFNTGRSSYYSKSQFHYVRCCRAMTNAEIIAIRESQKLEIVKDKMRRKLFDANSEAILNGISTGLPDKEVNSVNKDTKFNCYLWCDKCGHGNVCQCGKNKMHERKQVTRGQFRKELCLQFADEDKTPEQIISNLMNIAESNNWISEVEMSALEKARELYHNRKIYIEENTLCIKIDLFDQLRTLYEKAIKEIQEGNK